MYSNLVARVKLFLGKATFSCKMSPKCESQKTFSAEYRLGKVKRLTGTKILSLCLKRAG